jgi:hypothetical protein
MDDNANCGDKQPFLTSPVEQGVNETCSRVDKGRVIIVTEVESYLAVLGSFSSTLPKMLSPERQRS